MSTPICTVLLITYNHVKHIEKCIQSILSQKTKYTFIIKIFDDASTDGSSEIIQKYAKMYPNLIVAHIAQKNMGAQANIWRAYKSVDTKYCALIETDDCWCDDTKLERQINALEQNPSCSFACHNTRIINTGDKYRKSDNNKNMIKDKLFKNQNIFEYEDIKKISSGYMNHLNSRVIRMSCVDLDALVEKEDFLYDNCQFYYLLSRGKIYYEDRIMTVYNQTGQGAFSGSLPVKRIETHIDNLLGINVRLNKKYAEMIYKDIRNMLNTYSNANTTTQTNKIQQIKRYFIPRFILDIFHLPKYVIKAIHYLFKH